MASIADRWHVTDRATGRRARSERYGSGKRWQVRYRDPDGASRNRSFERKADAERFLAELQHRLNHGAYVDERAGRMLFREYAVEWLERQLVQPTTREAMEVRLRVHLLPEWGSWPLVRITPAAVQRWIRRASATLAATYVRLLLTNFSAILAAACEDGLSVRNPAPCCRREVAFHPTPEGDSLARRSHPRRSESGPGSVSRGCRGCRRVRAVAGGGVRTSGPRCRLPEARASCASTDQA